jgi:HSP20 family protein
MWKDRWNFEKMFEEFDKEFEEVEKEMKRMLEAFRDMQASGTAVAGPFYYGYSVTVGPDGKPKVQEFGNVRTEMQLAGQTGRREATVDTALNEKEGLFIITAEMPGVEKEDIKVQVLEGRVEIRAARGERSYETTVPVKAKLDKDSVQQSYANGILELKIKLAG